MVHDALLALTPELVELVKEEFELGLAEFAVSGLDEFLAEVVDLLWHP